MTSICTLKSEFIAATSVFEKQSYEMVYALYGLTHEEVESRGRERNKMSYNPDILILEKIEIIEEGNYA